MIEFDDARKENIKVRNPNYYTILFCCAKKYQTKFYALFYYENSKQRRTLSNCI